WGSRCAVGEENGSALDRVDQPAGDGWPYGGTPPGPADPSESGRVRLADVRCAVQDDGTIVSVVVDARVEPTQPQRVSVLTDVRQVSHEQPEAGHERSRVVREVMGHVVAAAATMGHQLAVEHAARIEIEDPETRLCRRARVVDEGQEAASSHRTATQRVQVRPQRPTERTTIASAAPIA